MSQSNKPPESEEVRQLLVNERVRRETLFDKWKEGMKLEWEFYKRNPEFPLIVLAVILLLIYSIIHKP